MLPKLFLAQKIKLMLLTTQRRARGCVIRSSSLVSSQKI